MTRPNLIRKLPYYLLMGVIGVIGVVLVTNAMPDRPAREFDEPDSEPAPTAEVSDGGVVPADHDAVLPSGDTYRFVWGMASSGSLVIDYAIEPEPTDGTVTVHAAQDVSVLVAGREYLQEPLEDTDRRIPGDGIAGFHATFDLDDADVVNAGDTVDVLMTTSDGLELRFDDVEVKDGGSSHRSVTGGW